MSDQIVRPEVDSVLQLLTETTNTENYSVDMTLNVKGTLVTGTVISTIEYLTSLADEFSEENEVEKNIYQKLTEAVASLEEEQEPEVNYVHMKDAKMFSESGKSLPSKGSVLWRGKLSDVDGFFLGKVTSE
ncbi:gas vesicle accessory protein GvpU [Salipaludibacillus daqingensis]|uniref:gas vesicle accessory protein GvpU n=1 Tax=Salipaludibacillus daqingensis TaxID=3041001 RepID=UPI002476BCF1|nr:gas vesicle accessory protein GvpU [Salipaludibacillus daqingensis]